MSSDIFNVNVASCLGMKPETPQIGAHDIQGSLKSLAKLQRWRVNKRNIELDEATRMLELRRQRNQ
jgi:hypothetical protein